MSDDPGEMTVQDLFDGLDEWGARLAQIVPRDDNDRALRAVIVVTGQPETDEILAAIAAVEARWENWVDALGRDDGDVFPGLPRHV